MRRKSIKLEFIIMLALVTFLGALAALGAELYIGKPEPMTSRRLDILLIIDRVENLAGIKLSIKYNAGILTYKRASKTKHSTSFLHIVNCKRPGLLKIVMASARGIKGDHLSLLRLTFELKGDLKPGTSRNTHMEITAVQLMSHQRKRIKCKTGAKIFTISY